jgi:hypothetical protein
MPPPDVELPSDYLARAKEYEAKASETQDAKLKASYVELARAYRTLASRSADILKPTNNA